ncbi:MAG: hypothetical protein QXD62_02690 [Candidatus Woesearchaeota archaeon]
MEFQQSFYKSLQGKTTKEKFSDTIYLLKHTFLLFGNKLEIFRPIINMSIMSLIVLLMLLVSILILVFFPSYFLLGLIFLLIDLFVLYPFSFYYSVRQKFLISAYAYKFAKGDKVALSDAAKEFKHTGSMITIAFVDYLLSHANTKNSNKRSNFINVLLLMFFSFILEVWDLAKHFLIPAMIIEQKSLKEVVFRLKEVKRNIPATIVGVLGLDFMGQVMVMLLGGIFLIFLALSFVLGILVAMISNALVFSIGALKISAIPLIVFVIIAIVIADVMKNFISGVKTVYFTFFYMALVRPKELNPLIRDEITKYLTFEHPKE